MGKKRKKSVPETRIETKHIHLHMYEIQNSINMDLKTETSQTTNQNYWGILEKFMLEGAYRTISCFV